MKYTIEDIARLANTSRSTVSRYLNGKKIREDTRKRLELVVKELNYRPNSIARNLATRKNKTLAIIVDSIAEIYMSEIILGVQIVALKYGYNCIFFSADVHKKDFEYTHLYLNGTVIGMIFIGFDPREKSEIEKIVEEKIPVVIIGDTAGINNIASFDVDSAYGTHLAINHLVDLGHRNILHLTGNLKYEFTRDRYTAFKNIVQRDKRLKGSIAYQINSTLTIENAYLETLKLFSDKKCSSITAIYTANDNLAFGALKALNELNIKVPEEISIIGFDNMHYTPYTIPSLSTIDNPRTELGIKAMEKLQEILYNPNNSYKKILLKPTLITRSSTSFRN